MDLDSMKYAELRTLAKELGLKANLKADKLLKLIKQHYGNHETREEEEEEEEEEQGQDQAAAAEPEEVKEEEEASEEVSGPAVFVNTRRGRGKSVKRKMPECEEQPGPTEADVEVEADPLPRGGKEPKKRRESLVKDSDQTEPEAPKETDAEEEEEDDMKDEAPVQNDAEKATKAPKPGRIPRYRGAQQNKKALKPVTPNFKKLHEAHFNKMESIDSYVQRKTKQMDSYKASAKEVKKPSEKTKPGNRSGTSLFSPAAPVQKPTEDKRGSTRAEAAGKDKVLFRPSVLSTRRINVRFSEATLDNEHKRSLVKTPARMSLCAVASSTPLKQAAEAKSSARKTFSAAKSTGTFVFTGNTSAVGTPGTQKKATFDLKASLSRPLAYKPHKGKLKPFADAKENKTSVTASAAKSVTVPDSHQTDNYKQHQVQTRDNRRERHTADRKQKKANLLGARRGLVMM